MRYVKEKYIKIFVVVICQTMIFSTLLLGGVKIELLEYPVVLSVSFLVIFYIVDFVREYNKHKNLMIIKEHIDLTTENLQASKNPVEQEYQELLVKLLEKNRLIEVEHESSYNDILEFITIWTHQVKTPLTALGVLSADLEDAKKNDVNARLFEIEQYTDMILQYLRMEGSTSDFVFKAYGVKSMVNQAVKYFARTFISKGISVKIDISDEVKIVTDEKWMVFVLKQIISNSLKYTDKGCITITMPTANSVCIVDTGIGIAPEDIPRIFERGYTGYNGRMDKKATGIGLFLVKSVLEKLNGTVEVESELGKGTKVTCNLTKM